MSPVFFLTVVNVKKAHACVESLLGQINDLKRIIHNNFNDKLTMASVCGKLKSAESSLQTIKTSCIQLEIENQALRTLRDDVSKYSQADEKLFEQLIFMNF
jgi:hypothetical protein